MVEGLRSRQPKLLHFFGNPNVGAIAARIGLHASRESKGVNQTLDQTQRMKKSAWKALRIQQSLSGTETKSMALAEESNAGIGVVGSYHYEPSHMRLNSGESDGGCPQCESPFAASLV